MKAIIRPKNYWFLYNIPIFGAALLLIFFANHLIANSMVIATFCLLGVTLVFALLSTKNLAPAKAISFVKAGVIALLIPSFFCLLLLAILKTLLHIHPFYNQVSLNISQHLYFLIAIASLLTVLLGHIMSYFFYHTDLSGTLSDTIKTYFHPPDEFVTTLNIFSGLAMQVVIIGSLSFVILILLQWLDSLLHIPVHPGSSLALLVIYYIFIMLPKIPYYERLIASLLQRGWRTGFIYLIAALFAIIAWLIVQIVIIFLPPDLLPQVTLPISQQYAPLGSAAITCANAPANVCSVQLVELRLLPNANAWLIASYSFIILCAPLIASLLARRGYLQDKRVLYCLLGFLVILFLIFPASLLPHISPGLVQLFAGLFIVVCLLTCIQLHGNQFNQIGFLPNKTNLKIRRPAKAVIPSLQGLHILIALYYLIGIYTYTFAFYLAAFPLAVMIVVTVVLFPLLWLKQTP